MNLQKLGTARAASVMVWTVVALVSARVVRWSRVVRKMLSQRGPASPSPTAQRLANGAGADVFFCDALVNLPLSLEHTVDLERTAEIPGLRFSGF